MVDIVQKKAIKAGLFIIIYWLLIAVAALYFLDLAIGYYNVHVRTIFPAEIRDQFYPYYKLSSVPGLIYEMNRDILMPHDSAPTNSLGFRDRDYRLDKPQDVFRIVAIGDSMCYGLGLQDRVQTWVKLLERSLNERRKDKINYEVINTGVVGYNLTQDYINLRQKAWVYQPDMVLCSLFADDLLPAYIPNLFRNRTANRINAYLLSRSALWKYMHYHFFWLYRHQPDIIKISHERNLSVLKEMIEFAREQKIPLLFLLHPTLTLRYDDQLYYRDIIDVLNNAKAPFISLHREYGRFVVNKEIPRLSINPAVEDPHPNIYGSALIAGIVADYLSEHRAWMRSFEEVRP